MRPSRLPTADIVAAAFLIAGLLALAQGPTRAQPRAPQPAQAPAVAPGPYKPVPITLPPALNDPGFVAFRKELADIARRKDRAGLARLVAADFFWIPEDVDLAERSKAGIDNLARAFSLDGKEAIGWEALGIFAAEPTVMPDPQRNGVFCAPAEPGFDEKAADELAGATQTDASDWGFPIRDGVELRAAPRRDAQIVDKLGLYLVRILPDASPSNAVHATFVKVMLPSGKTGYAPVDQVLPIGGEQLCYRKDAGGWKVAGFFGGEPSQ